MYLDDIVELLCSLCDHNNHVEQVFSLLQDAEVCFKLRKCNFLTGTFDYLGRFIRSRRLKIVTNKMDAIKEPKSPAYITELRSFLGLSKGFRRPVPIYAWIVAPLNNKLERSGTEQIGVLTGKQLSAIQ